MYKIIDDFEIFFIKLIDANRTMRENFVKNIFQSDLAQTKQWVRWRLTANLRSSIFAWAAQSMWCIDVRWAWYSMSTWADATTTTHSRMWISSARPICAWTEVYAKLWTMDPDACVRLGSAVSFVKQTRTTAERRTSAVRKAVAWTWSMATSVCARMNITESTAMRIVIRIIISAANLSFWLRKF